MSCNHAALNNDFKSVTEDLEIGFKLKFEYSFIFAVNTDHAHIFSFIRVFHYFVYVTIWYTVNGGFLWVLDAVWLEMQLVITEVKLANIFGFV